MQHETQDHIPKMHNLEVKRPEEVEDDDDKWVYDSSVDNKGNLPSRASTGAWRAAFFIIAIEVSERLSYFGIATTLIVYLTRVLDQDLKTAAKSVNNWTGVTTVMPLIGGFIADAYLGRFSTVLISTSIYIAGLTLLTMSRVIPALAPCSMAPCPETRKLHEIVFFVAIYMISVGTGGHKPSLESFGADQFDDGHELERRKKMSFFNWWSFGLCSGLLLGVTVVVYVQDRVGWGASDIILTAVMILSLAIFLVGMPFYRYRKPGGSPLTPMLQVVVAAVAKRSLPYPSSTDALYEIPEPSQRRLPHTRRLEFLDKAAIVADTSHWRLATVTRVEEVKLIINIVPIWVLALPFGVCISQSTTFFIKQAAAMDRHITPSFIFPPASIYSLAALGMIVSVTIYDRLLVPVMRRATGNERGITILQRIGVGMLFSILTMVAAALVERKRLALSVTQQQMSAFWLAPQFLIIGFGDGFTIVGLQEFFYDQVPDSMRSIGIALYLSVIGAANFLSSLLISLIDCVTSRRDSHTWFGHDLNTSRLDKFYSLLGAIMILNLFLYTFFARRYHYKSDKQQTAEVTA